MFMKRSISVVALAAGVAMTATALRADVKTVEHTKMTLAGVMGSLMNRFGGSAAKDGITSTVAVRGNRKSSTNDLTGEIIDLTEQKVYTLDVKKKEYTVKTFAQIRADFEKQRADAQKNAASMKPADQTAAPNQNTKQMQFDVTAKETGQRKNVAGYDTREEILTITAHEKDKTIEESGGFIMTLDEWLAPKIAALDEVRQFEMKYYQAIYGESIVADMQQMAQMSAMYAAFQPMMGKMQTEGAKLSGTPLETTTTFDSVKSADQMKQAAAQQQQQSSGGGLGGMLAKRLAGNRGNQSQDARGTVMTTTMNVQSIATSVSDADLAIPAGFKEKK
jgi:hypothetical protein